MRFLTVLAVAILIAITPVFAQTTTILDNPYQLKRADNYYQACRAFPNFNNIADEGEQLVHLMACMIYTVGVVDTLQVIKSAQNLAEDKKAVCLPNISGVELIVYLVKFIGRNDPNSKNPTPMVFAQALSPLWGACEK